MLLIGLTGSIATGKSTVSAMLSAPPYSLPIIDADVLARRAVAPGTRAYGRIVSYFGPTTPDLLEPAATAADGGDDGRPRPLDRAALGRRVFGAGAERVRDRAALNGIVHPAVRAAMARAVLACYARGEWAAVLDVPLLFEAGLDPACGVVVVVGVRDGAVQLARLLARDGGRVTEAEARERVASQGDVAGKVARVACRGRGWGEVVWNDGGREELAREVEALMARLRRGSPRWWAWVLLACPPLAAAVAAWCLWKGWLARRTWERMQRAKSERAKL